MSARFGSIDDFLDWLVEEIHHYCDYVMFGEECRCYSLVANMTAVEAIELTSKPEIADEYLIQLSDKELEELERKWERISRRFEDYLDKFGCYEEASEIIE